jgi:hypothetical protein
MFLELNNLQLEPRKVFVTLNQKIPDDVLILHQLAVHMVETELSLLVQCDCA